MKINIEHTDTYGKDANYSWVTRKTIDMGEESTNLQIVRRAKAILGINGIPCRKSDFGDMIRLDLIGYCQCVFITFEY